MRRSMLTSGALALKIGNDLLNGLNGSGNVKFAFAAGPEEAANKDGVIQTIRVHSSSSTSRNVQFVTGRLSGTNMSIQTLTPATVSLANVGYISFTNVNLSVTKGDFLGIYCFTNNANLFVQTPGNGNVGTGKRILTYTSGGTPTAGMTIMSPNFDSTSYALNIKGE